MFRGGDNSSEAYSTITRAYRNHEQRHQFETGYETMMRGSEQKNFVPSLVTFWGRLIANEIKVNKNTNLLGARIKATL